VSLERFHKAQAILSAGYETALAEIRAGQKRSHWIWYIFPQVEGLGRSSTARAYALRDLDEACDYLEDRVLGARYEEIARAAEQQLKSGVPLKRLMGSQIDTLKLVSSVTLFRAAAGKLAKGNAPFTSLAECCDAILAQAAAQGYAPCRQTLAQLAL